MVLSEEVYLNKQLLVNLQLHLATNECFKHVHSTCTELPQSYNQHNNNRKNTSIVGVNHFLARATPSPISPPIANAAPPTMAMPVKPSVNRKYCNNNSSGITLVEHVQILDQLNDWLNCLSI